MENLEEILSFVEAESLLEGSSHDIQKFIVILVRRLQGIRDPKERIMEILKLLCRLYDAEWTGTIRVDLDVGVWTPTYWYHAQNGPMGEMLLQEYEPSKNFTRWVKALHEKQSVFCLDPEDLREEFPAE